MPTLTQLETVRDIWNEYLKATMRAAENGRYDDVEPLAWRRLTRKLRELADG